MKLPVNSQDTARSRLDTFGLGHTTSLAKVDKTQLIKSYLHSQQLHRAHFEKEGLQFRATWRHEAGDINLNARPVDCAKDVFATPILEPRVPEQKRKREEDREKGRPTDSKAGRDATTRLGEKDVQHLKIQKESAPPTSSKPQKHTVVPTGASCKRLGPCDKSLKERMKVHKESRLAENREPDVERCSLLAARRERRRAKKARVEAKVDSDNDTPSPKKPAKKVKKTGISVGLALMHGFSAKNVGSSRLTMRPNFGVFNKGKASAKAQVAADIKKKPKHSPVWTEAGFLNTQREKHAQSSASKDVPASSVTESVSPPLKKRKMSSAKQKDTCNYEPKELVQRQGCKSSSHSSSPTQRGNAATPEQPPQSGSIIWDIESRGDEDVKSTEGDTPIAATSHDPQSALSHENGTLILNILTSRWNAPDSNAAIDHRLVTPCTLGSPTAAQDLVSRQEFRKRTSSPSRSSLCPSQSVSQATRPAVQPGPDDSFVCSNYFQQHKQLALEVRAIDISDLSASRATFSGENDDISSLAHDSDHRFPRPAEFVPTAADLDPPILDHLAQDAGAVGSFSNNDPPYINTAMQDYSFDDPLSVLGQSYDDGGLLDSRTYGSGLALSGFATPPSIGDVGLVSDWQNGIDLFAYSDGFLGANYEHTRPGMEDDISTRSATRNTCDPAPSYFDVSLDVASGDEESQYDPQNCNDENFGDAVRQPTDASGWSYESANVTLPSDVVLEDRYKLDDPPLPADPSIFYSHNAPTPSYPEVGTDSLSQPYEASEPSIAIGSLKIPTLSQVEEDVARHLQDHWSPQRL